MQRQDIWQAATFSLATSAPRHEVLHDRHHDVRLPLTCTVHGTHPEVMQRPALRQDRQCLIHVAHRRPSKVLIIAHKERCELGPPVQSQSQSWALILSRKYGRSASCLSFRALTRGPLLQSPYKASAHACFRHLGHFTISISKGLALSPSEGLLWQSKMSLCGQQVAYRGRSSSSSSESSRVPSSASGTSLHTSWQQQRCTHSAQGTLSRRRRGSSSGLG